MSVEKFVIATITWARDKNEENLIYNSLSILSSKNLPVIVVDGGSSSKFLKNIKELSGISVISASEKGLQRQILESLKIARKYNRHIFYTESDKADFFRRHLDKFLSQASALIEQEPNFGVILACRSFKSFSTYPTFQKASESYLNQALVNFTEGNVKDFAFGPRIISTQLIPYLDLLTEDIGWGWMSYLLILAKKLEKEVFGVELDLTCPQEQRAESKQDKLHRLFQLKNHIEGIEQALRISI